MPLAHALSEEKSKMHLLAQVVTILCRSRVRLFRLLEDPLLHLPE